MERKPGVTGIDIILIQVSDLKRSLAFWKDGLGIPFRGTGYEDDSVEAKVGEVTLILHPDFTPAMKKAKRGVGIAIHLKVEDADAYYSELVERGVAPQERPEDKPWGREFSVVDPDGYPIEILEPVKGEHRTRG